ncbi:CGNR zinc finger domain-containing protein [Sulfuriflexus mobilis]|uniref:CGNR zinc finger domain-containing protein n=1 Tax=Sulfuriflexus mobilis TaxID=1811807 RepID=UPI000F82A9AC|nr:CGNR zinc finger domain-containing protein [Sulfuriflexus mobilis]
MNMQDRPFVFIGNNVAVDFINTEIVSHGDLIDLLRDGADLVRWAQGASLSIQSPLRPTDFKKALGLRAVLKTLYAAMIDKLPAPPEALTALNQHLSRHCSREVLRFNKRESGYTLEPTQGPLSMPVLLAHLAYEGAKLLASPQATRLKHCGNPDCVLIFLDTSRSQKRRWCSMETCGNRAKVATHYRNSLSQGKG